MARLKSKLYRIVFRSDTRAGRIFDLVLLWLIVLSVLAVILESIPEVSVKYQDELFLIELFFTVQKTFEYLEANKLRMVPRCAFVITYLKRHPEWNRLLDESAAA